MSLSAQEFNYIRDLVRQRSAIVLDTGKEYLVESKLLPVVRRAGLPTLSDLVARLQMQPASPLHRQVIEAMTTNETTFFRDFHPFEALKTAIIPEIMSNRAASRTLDIWCGACSSGQEPYTIAILIREHFPQLASWELRLLGTDLSTEMLERARAGVYNQIEINRGLPAALLVKFFSMHGPEWHIKDELRQMVEFRELNLAGTWPALTGMDLICLRNVLIYFDNETKKSILGKIRRLLRPDGYLFLGSAETTLNLDEDFERVQPEKAGCYRLRRT